MQIKYCTWIDLEAQHVYPMFQDRERQVKQHENVPYLLYSVSRLRPRLSIQESPPSEPSSSSVLSLRRRLIGLSAILAMFRYVQVYKCSYKRCTLSTELV